MASAFAVAVAALLVVGARVLVALNTPALLIKEGADSVVIDLRWLGDYEAVVSRLRVVEASSGLVIWEVQSESSDSRLFQVPVRLGSNAVSMKASHGSFRVVEPKASGTFVIEKDRNYTVEVWGDARKWFSAKEEFRISSQVSTGRKTAQPGATDNPDDAQR